MIGQQPVDGGEIPALPPKLGALVRDVDWASLASRLRSLVREDEHPMGGQVLLDADDWAKVAPGERMPRADDFEWLCVQKTFASVSATGQVLALALGPSLDDMSEPGVVQKLHRIAQAVANHPTQDRLLFFANFRLLEQPEVMEVLQPMEAKPADRH